SSPEYVMNAFFTPWMPGYPSFPGYAKNLICLGRGYGEDLSYDSDVMLHEFTHYISQNAMDYAEMGYYDQYGMAVMSGAINEGTDPPFDAETRYHVVIWHQNCATVEATVAATSTKKDLPLDGGVETDAAVEDAQPQPDAEVPLVDAGAGGGDAGTGPGASADEVEPGGGCGCRTTGGAGSAPAAAGLLALVLGLWVRRRRS
ncbi:MAG: MYXO-CTERM sorting domain-containing protein, partial [Myxococcota bacterium]